MSDLSANSSVLSTQPSTPRTQHRRTRAWALLCGLFLLAPVSSAQRPPLRVACIGDSITQGVGVQNSATQSYPAQLRKLLGNDYQVGNFGHSGATLCREGWLPFWTQPEYQKALDFQPDIAVVMLGTNDSEKSNWPKSVDSFEPTAKELIRNLRALRSRPKIYLVLPVPSWTSDGRRQNTIEGVIPLLKQAARETGIPTIDLWTPLETDEAMFPDKLHPNESGAAIMASEVYEAIVDRRLSKTGWKVVQFDSQEVGEGEAINAIDGDPLTYWHTRYSGSPAQYPHEISVDLGQMVSIGGFSYLPRQDGGVNGQVKDYEFYVSEDGKAWGQPVAKGVFKGGSQASRVRLAAPVMVRYFRFVALSEQNGGIWTTVGELDILKAISSPGG